MYYTKRSILILFILLSVIKNGYTQGQAITDITGSVIKVQAYIDIQGSPYFINDWTKGSVKFANGKVLNDIALKYDQVKDEVIFAGKGGEDFYFNDPVSEFSMNFSVFRNGYKPSKKFTSSTFYEVLVDGNITLLKKNAKSIYEKKEFNSATVDKVVNDNISYYISKQNEIFQLRKIDLKSLIEALDPQKSDVILDFAKLNDYDSKREGDLKKIVEYYNSLK